MWFVTGRVRIIFFVVLTWHALLPTLGFPAKLDRCCDYVYELYYSCLPEQDYRPSSATYQKHK